MGRHDNILKNVYNTFWQCNVKCKGWLGRWFTQQIIVTEITLNGNDGSFPTSFSPYTMDLRSSPTVWLTFIDSDGRFSTEIKPEEQ